MVAFENLGGDALLVAPCPQENRDFSSLATFIRTADPDQVNEFWIKSAENMLNRVKEVSKQGIMKGRVKKRKISWNF